MSFSAPMLPSLHEDAPRYRAKSRAKPFPKESAEREWLARALWKAFPGARSENDLAETVSGYLKSLGRRAGPRTVRNWLQEESGPHFRYIAPILARLPDDEVAAYVKGRLQ